MSKTFTEIIREVTARFNYGRLSLGTTTAEVDTASVKCSTFADSGLSATSEKYRGCVIRIDEKVTAGPDIGEAQRVSTFDGPNGDFTTNAFTANVKSGTDFSVHRALSPSEKEDIINRTLRHCYHQAFHFLSVLPDWDWEDGTLTTNWEITTAGSEAMTQHSTATEILYGRYAMKLDNVDVANAYVKNKVTVRCHEGEVWELWVPMMIDRTDAGTATLIAYDATNGANIETATTDHLGLTLLGFSFTTPSGCKELEVHMKGVTSAMISYWGPVCLLPVRRKVIDLPSWLTVEGQLRGVGVLRPGTGTSGTNEDNAYRALEETLRTLPYEEEIYPLHANPNRMTVKYPGGGPLCLEAYRPFAELTEVGAGPSPSTSVDFDTVVTGALARCHEAVAKRLGNSDPSRANWHLREAQALNVAFRELLESNDYAIPETELELTPRVAARAR